MLNLPVGEMLGDALFMPASGVNGEPLRERMSLLLMCNRDSLNCGNWGIDIRAVSQGFAILTWVKVFHMAASRTSKAAV